MSEIEYNDLIFEISERLGELNVLNRLLFLCRGKLRSGSEESIQDVRSLFTELEECNRLGIDRLEVMKDLLKRVREWALLRKCKKFESTRKDFVGLLEVIIPVLDKLNDLERLISVCRGKIPQACEGNINDVRSLFKELENSNCLGIDCLGILKEILIELKKEDLLKEVEKFEKRRCDDEDSECRKAQAAAVVSSVRATGERIIGEVRVHCTFRKLSGALLVVGTGLILRRCSSLEEFAEAFTVAVLPAANALRAISEGSVCFTIQAENEPALEALWKRYQDGTLQRNLQNFLVTDLIRQLADGEEVMLTVYIDEKEFRNALTQQVLLCPDARGKQHSLKMHRRNSDSSLYCKEWYNERPKERIIQLEQPVINQAKNLDRGRDGEEEEQSRYFDREKLEFVVRYLNKENTDDARSETTETSDSGITGTHDVQSELGIDETSDFRYNLCLKDLSETITEEVAQRLESDPVAKKHFYQSFGLRPKKTFPGVLYNISELFPDTPVSLLKDVFEALQLYDLVDLLEKAKPGTCALRPVYPPKEIGKKLKANNRPTTFINKVKALIIDNRANDADDTAENISSFFKHHDLQSEFTTITAKPIMEIINGLKELKETKQFFESDRAEIKEKELKECLVELQQQNKWLKKDAGFRGLFSFHPYDRVLNRLRECIAKESELKKQLDEQVERRKKWKKGEKPKIEKGILQKEDELKQAKENWPMTISSAMDNWINSKGERQSVLFAVFEIGGSEDNDLSKMIEGRLSETLALIPNDAKLVITPRRMRQMGEGPETLQVVYSAADDNFMTTMLNTLSKRWQTLDLISIMQEVQRTLTLRKLPKFSIEIIDSLSLTPRLTETEDSSLLDEVPLLFPVFETELREKAGIEYDIAEENGYLKRFKIK